MIVDHRKLNHDHLQAHKQAAILDFNEKKYPTHYLSSFLEGTSPTTNS